MSDTKPWEDYIESKKRVEKTEEKPKPKPKGEPSFLDTGKAFFTGLLGSRNPETEALGRDEDPNSPDAIIKKRRKINDAAAAASGNAPAK